MPGMNGYDACKALRKMIQEKTIPPLNIVAVTADVTELNLQQCQEAGFDETLSKPVDISEVKRVLKKYLE